MSTSNPVGASSSQPYQGSQGNQVNTGTPAAGPTSPGAAGASGQKSGTAQKAWSDEAGCAVLRGLGKALDTLAGVADALAPIAGGAATSAGKALRGAGKTADALAPCSDHDKKGPGDSGLPSDPGHRTTRGPNSDELMAIKQAMRDYLKYKPIIDAQRQMNRDAIRNLR